MSSLKHVFSNRRRLLILFFVVFASLLVFSSHKQSIRRLSFTEKTFNSSQRLWFLSNGSKDSIPPPKDVQNLPLWPEDDPDGDRIVNQLLFRPLIKPKRRKKIFLKTSPGDMDWRLRAGEEEFRECPVSECELVGEEEAREADLIFFKPGFDEDIHSKHVTERPLDQIWSQFQIESPLNSRMSSPDSSINWTLTYRRDSEISVPYYKFFRFEKPLTHALMPNMNNKTKKVAWFVSNCDANNDRLEFAKELSKHLPVDIFGGCGPLKCTKSGDACWRMLSEQYKFYLSFENSNCEQYITEKFWNNALGNDVVPVVMGARPAFYSHVAPPHSLIHVDAFPSVSALAQYLKLLDANDALYRQFFEWKRLGEVKPIFMWCRVCAMLHSNEKRFKSYERLNDWFREEKCVRKRWK